MVLARKFNKQSTILLFIQKFLITHYFKLQNLGGGNVDISGNLIF